MRNAVRRVLRKYKYPPDKQEKAIETVDRAGRIAVRRVGERIETKSGPRRLAEPRPTTSTPICPKT